MGLESPSNKGGISLAAPRRLASAFHSLPPILHILNKDPILGYSKGSRGLSVLPRVSGIFTTTTISPGSSLRQHSSRYAIHARRNLPDKELRYLRTLIVRAAIHRCFGSELPSGEPELTPSLNIPALGRRQSLYFVLRLRRDLCF